MRAILAMVATVLALIMAPVGALAQPANDPAASAFTREVVDRAAAEIGAGNVRVVGPLRIVVVEPNGAQSQMVLDQSYSLCVNRGEQACEKAKTDLVASIVTTHRGESPELSQARLRLLIRSSGYCAEMSRFYVKQSDIAVVEALAPGLCAALMADFVALADAK